MFFPIFLLFKFCNICLIKMETMKRLSVFAASILLTLFLFNSFVLREKVAGKVFRNNEGLSNAIFKSTDGGLSWQDISKGLPGKLLEDGIRGDSIFANDKGLFL